MKFYKLEDQVIISDKELTAGTELIPNTTDAAGEKHVPVIMVHGEEVTVKIGTALHRVDSAADGHRYADEMAETRNET